MMLLKIAWMASKITSVHTSQRRGDTALNPYSAHVTFSISPHFTVYQKQIARFLVVHFQFPLCSMCNMQLPGGYHHARFTSLFQKGQN
jgi:hypothetical protein